MSDASPTIFHARSDLGFIWSHHVTRCALGKNGLVPAELKREGDNKSPIGEWPMKWVYYRPDREPAPTTSLPVIPLDKHMGWCDDPSAGAAYNTPVRLPFKSGHEKLWRHDHVYDLIVVLGHNDNPVAPGLGSAIFMHLKRNDYEPTQGCVALSRTDLLDVLAAARPGDAVRISP